MLSVIHLCQKCKNEMSLQTVDELETVDFGTLSILIYYCEECDCRISVIDENKTYLNEVGNYVLKSSFINLRKF